MDIDYFDLSRNLVLQRQEALGGSVSGTDSKSLHCKISAADVRRSFKDLYRR